MDFTAPTADWTAFDPDRDLPPLRARLAALEAAEGVTQVHFRVTEEILAHPGARRVPPVRHAGRVHGAALSPCGRYLAVGTSIEVPEGAWDAEYEDGGVLHVFELATGGRVGGITEPGALRGGIGWTDYPGAIRWSADSARLGLAYDTNMVGVWDAFSGDDEPLGAADTTYGGSSPPPFALAPDGRAAFIGVSAGEEHAVPGCLVPLADGEISWYPHEAPPRPAEGEPRLMSAVFGPAFEDSADDLFLDVEYVAGWSRDGTRVHIVDRRHLFAVDIATGLPLWIHEHGSGYVWWDEGAPPAAFSPDGARVAWYTGDRLFIADAATGGITAEFDREEAAVLVWGRDRLAVLGAEGIRIIDGDAETVRMPVAARIGRGMASDIVPLAWSPDGTRFAVVTGQGDVEVWDLDGAGEPAARFGAPADAVGLHWGDTLAVLGNERLGFRTPEGATVREVDLRDQPAAWSVGGRHAWPAHWEED
ncbi:WD40 repeat domain-containing protein [Phytomonospora endophytica]|uniref:WD40 repeat domain-containing protein n=1 Tax=Phytomonospora endophytica TaxID=714109 RepID=A0A841FKT4_9ACTN|nr:LpqB family beta-propeller domain-containing protein [Phytomonospora endophytica]MBB6036474.1 hypothetical protein [Phytomonospora endophytica]GIG65796.1 hypothetical protein Pen01_20910 [Phytomonospora endophytica]